MTRLAELLESATTGVDATFTSRDVEHRVRQRRIRRRAAAALAVLLVVLGVGATVSAGTGDGRDSQVTTEPTTVAPRWSGRWVLMAVSTASTVGVGSGESPELILRPDGRVSGSSGCGAVSGRWSEDGVHLALTDVEVTIDACDGATLATADLLRRVLTGAPTTSGFEGQPDTLKLVVGDDFAGFLRDVSYGTATDPSKSGEVIKFPLGDLQLVADVTSVALSPLPAEVRAVRWQAGARSVGIARTLGGMPFSQRELLLSAKPTPEAITVRGRPAVVQQSGDGAAVTWSPADDITLALRAAPMTTAEAVALASSVDYQQGHLTATGLTEARGVGRDQQILQRTEVAAEGRVNEIPWRFVVYRTNQGTCTEVLLSGGGSATCGEPEAFKASLLHAVGGQILHGSAPAGTATVRVEYPDGEQVIPARSLRGYTGRSYFAATVPREVSTARVVALDRDNNEIGHVDDVSSGGSIGAG